MKKNVASQSIGAEMITIADGSNFTGTVTVLITKDNGTQSASGGTAPAHKGNGYHSYTPTQAETDADHIAFTFTGTGAITATVQVFTSFPQTADHTAAIADLPNNSEFNARTIVSANYALEASLQTVDTNVDSILVDTGTTIPANQTTINNNVLLIDTAPMRGTDGANTTTPPSATTISTAVWSETARVLTAGTNIVLAKGVGVTGFTDLSAAQVNAEVLDVLVTDTFAEVTIPAATASIKDMIHYTFSRVRNKTTQTATTLTVRNDADSGNLGTATVSDDGTTFTKGEES